MGIYPFYVYLICLGALLGILLLKKNWEGYLKSFPIFLLLSAAVELTGFYLGSRNQNNVALYNLFTAFEFCYYVFIISLIIVRPTAKLVMRCAVAGYFVFAVINIFFVQKLHVFHTTSYAVGCILVVVCCMYYFLELFLQPRSVRLSTTPAFWICTALLFYYCCSFTLFGFMTTWAKVPLMVANFVTIVNILNTFLYSLYIIAILCTRAPKYISLRS
jgi:hypothetical protein